MILHTSAAAAQLASAGHSHVLSSCQQLALRLLRAVHTVTSEQQRVLTVALVGYPNAGKSELTNKLIGVKISGVSTKRNTTLEPRLGAFTSGHTQVVLYDTPGLVTRPEATNPLERLRSAWHVAASADIILYIVDAEKQFKLRERTLLDLAKQLSAGPKGQLALSTPWPRPPLVLLLNKRDKLPRDLAPSVLKQLEAHFRDVVPFRRVYSISALEGQGIGTLRQYLLHLAQPGPWLLPPGQCHVSTPGELAVELVREKLLRRLHKELPYSLGVALVADRPLRVEAGMHDGRAPAALGNHHRLGGDVNRHDTANPGLQKQLQQSSSDADPQHQDGVHSVEDGSPFQQPPMGRFVHVEVLAANPRVKNIVIGPGGSIIDGYVAKPTQQELCDIFKQEVRLSVSVKVAA